MLITKFLLVEYISYIRTVAATVFLTYVRQRRRLAYLRTECYTPAAGVCSLSVSTDDTAAAGIYSLSVSTYY
jgi:SOS-response transcriptional repressor LexA